jgi:processing peptidase subunit beta
LKNGLTVASEPSFGNTCTVGVYINSGSVYETKKTNGAAHFLEHLAFKGTTRRTQEQIELEVENMGAHLNAYTSREMTAYYAKCLSADVPKAVDVISDILTNSKLTKEAVDRERSVILREAVEVENTPEEVIFEHLHSVAYQGTSHAFTILGPEENIQSLQREDLQDYIKTHYTAPRMLVAAAGNIKHEDLVKLAEAQFGHLPSVATGPSALAPSFTGSAVTIRNDEMPACHVALAFEGAAYSDPDYFVFLVMQTLLGSWDRNLGSGKNLVSRLAEEVATDGLAHSFSAFNTPYHKTSLFGVYAVSTPDKVNDLTYAVVKSMVRLANEVTDAEAERARNKLKAALLMALDSTHAVCEEMGRQLLGLGRRMSTAEIFMRIDMVNAKEVKRVALEYVYDNEIAMAAMGPIKDLPDYGVIRGWTYWNRT